MNNYPVKTTLTHIIEAIHGIHRFVEDGQRDEKTLFAVARQLEIIGEAANRLSNDFRKQHSTVPWRDMIDMRNFIMHGYDQISEGIVWETIAEDLPELEAQISVILQKTLGD